MANMNMKEFLEHLETGGQLLGEGREKLNQQETAALKAAGITNPKWTYKPEDYDLIVAQLTEGGNKGGKWAVVYLTEAEIGDDEDEEDIFGESLSRVLGEDIGLKVLEVVEGDFLETVQLCIETAQSKGAEGGFTQSKVKELKTKAETSK